MKGTLKRGISYHKLIKNIDIIDELQKRGISGKITRNNLMICCPIHGERNPSMGVGLTDKKGICQCLSCDWAGNFFHLLSFLDDIPFFKLIERYTKDNIDVKDLMGLKEFFYTELKKTNVKPKGIKYFNIKFMDKFNKPKGNFLRYLTQERKLTKEIIEKFKVKSCDGTGRGYGEIWKNRIIIPIIDTNGEFAGATARYIYDCDKKDKVRKIRDSDISKVLFGLINIKKGSPLIGVEGEIDVMYLQQFNVPAIKTGKFLSKSMIKKIMQYTDEFYYCPDGDIPWINKHLGKEKDCVKYQLKEISKYMEVKAIRLPEDKDSNNLTEKEVKEIFGKFINKKYFK